MRLLLVGYGKMGQLVEQMALAQGIEIASRIDVGTGDWSPPADVAIDFSTAGALKENFPRYLDRKLPVVIGTTGWSDLAPAFRQQAERAGLGVVASANFSIGANLFEMMASNAARLMRQHPHYGAWIHEAHHATKRDAPSGTALLLRDVMPPPRIPHGPHRSRHQGVFRAPKERHPRAWMEAGKRGRLRRGG